MGAGEKRPAELGNSEGAGSWKDLCPPALMG